jgi:hypothetical protein
MSGLEGATARNWTAATFSIFALLIASCDAQRPDVTTSRLKAARIRRLELRMTREQVVELLGAPTSLQTTDPHAGDQRRQELIYEQRTGWWRTGVVRVFLRGNRVEQVWARESTPLDKNTVYVLESGHRSTDNRQLDRVFP